MSTVPRGYSVYYGTWNTALAGWSPDGPHVMRETQNGFVLTFDVLLEASNTAELRTRIDAFRTALGAPNQQVIVYYGGVAITDFDPRSLSFRAQSSQAAIAPLEYPRSELLRAYQVTITGTKVADLDPDELGRRSAEYLVSSTGTGIRTLTATIEYTPMPFPPRSAYEVALDPTLGIAKLVEDYLTTTLGSTLDAWDEGEIQFKRSQTDRFVTAILVRREVIYPQGVGATPLSDVQLRDAFYSVATVQETSDGITDLETASIYRVRCTFSADVPKSQTQDLDAVIHAVALPAIKNRVRLALRTQGTLYTTKNELKGLASTNQILGYVDFVAVVASSVLSASKVYQDFKRQPATYLDVLNDSDYDVDEHLGKPLWVRVVRIGTTEATQFGDSIDSYVSQTLAGLVDAEVFDQAALGFKLLDETPEAVEKVGRYPGDPNLTVLRCASVLRFRRVSVRRVETGESTTGGQGGENEDVETAEAPGGAA